MNGRALNKRLERLERDFYPASDGTFTLEELCRCMWRRDKTHFLRVANDTPFSYFVGQFNFEDARKQTVAPRIGRRPST
jgi:hypothetical protein